ncbi:asparaginase [Labedaea rhizosphaerae]|uniref:L-asparaginase n=1 Tax=Labedaea rhizosphaerae TaxID=598644 RepID=A0A4R6SM04_LABRH|nr:asparaginase [Labedaea rhizosphaerae]TDQ04901.1 L-asparaginase [Labedaea rhizosphaerae]
MTKVAVFGLGGTIAMTAGEHGGAVPALSAGQLVAAVPGLAESGIELAVVEFRQLPGASLTFADLAELADAIAAHDADGVVITQGTDTIEETAYQLDLTHADDRPLVVTGAMRNPSLAGADGPANLLAAVRVAADPAARGLGCVVVLADEVHAAARVRKTHSTSVATFRSPNGGPLGYLVEGGFHLVNRPAHRLVLPRATTHPKVALATITLDDDGTLLAAADRCDGLVVAAMGVGHVPQRLLSTLDHLAARIPVVLASRTGAGPVLTTTYGFPGSERDLVARGLIPAGYLDLLKARILLRHLLATGAGQAAIKAAFARS